MTSHNAVAAVLRKIGRARTPASCHARSSRVWRRKRLPVILQINRLECGAACLAMVLSSFGRRTSLSECSRRLQIGRNGVTARKLVETARDFGLEAKAYSAESVDLEHIALPAIAHWNFNHFLVVEAWSPTTVRVIDPATGRLALSASEFDAGFTGVVLTFVPSRRWTSSSDKAQASRIRCVANILRGNYSSLGQIVGTSLILQVLGLTMPLVSKILVDDVFGLDTSSTLTLVGVGITVLVLCHAVMAYLRAMLLLSLETRCDIRLMTGFLEHVLALPLRFFQERATGDLLMRLSSNVTLRQAFTTQTVSALLDGCLVATYLAILFAVRPSFGAVVCCAGIAQAGMLLIATAPSHRLLERELAGAAASQTYLVQVLSGIETVKASAAEQRALAHWSNLFHRHQNVFVRRAQLSAIVGTAVSTLNMATPLVLLWMGTAAVVEGHLTVGTMLGLNMLAVAFLTPLASLVSSFQQLQLAGAHVDRITDVLDSPVEQAPDRVYDAPPRVTRIEARRVAFRYEGGGPPVLRDISVTIEPGQKIALVGRTGSGKSTLAKLLLAMHMPDDGELLYEGTPVQLLDFRNLRSKCGVVLQDPFLFSGSLRENIAFNNPSISLEAVINASRIACIHDEIMRMPMGYETRLADGGAGLSGGQRQRVALARAVAHAPSILLLDEASSHLDAVTEQEVDRNLSKLTCTRIVIAHRLSTIRNSDLILVLDNGTIVERGSHYELFEKGGIYCDLVRSQTAVADSDALEDVRVPR